MTRDDFLPVPFDVDSNFLFPYFRNRAGKQVWWLIFCHHVPRKTLWILLYQMPNTTLSLWLQTWSVLKPALKLLWILLSCNPSVPWWTNEFIGHKFSPACESPTQPRRWLRRLRWTRNENHVGVDSPALARRHKKRTKCYTGWSKKSTPNIPLIYTTNWNQISPRDKSSFGIETGNSLLCKTPFESFQRLVVPLRAIIAISSHETPPLSAQFLSTTPRHESRCYSIVYGHELFIHAPSSVYSFHYSAPTYSTRNQRVQSPSTVQ